MNRVAASTAQIEAVLHTNPGLMVELKAWVAKDATDHGQLISDSDLTDAAIFDRLETDIEFRSVATRLLQKYGYLLPKVNPDSPQAKQQELLTQERTKWLAQDQEEQLTQARQQSSRTMQGQNCNSEADPACRSSQRPYAASQQEPGSEGTPSGGVPPNRQNTPRLPQRREPTLEEAELMQTGGFPLGSLPLQPETSSGDLQSLFSGADGGNSGTAGLSRGASGQLGPFSAASTPRMNSNTSGNLYPDLSSSAIGVDRQSAGLMNGGLYAGSNNYRGQPEVESPGYEAESYNPSRPNRAGRVPSSVNPSQMMLRQPNPYTDIPSLYDMYLQASPQPPTPERFGMEVFENGARDLQMIPMDLPVGPDYVVGPGDALAIDLWGGVSQRLLRTVDTEGRLSLPEVGPVLVAGKSMADVQQTVQHTLRSQFRDVSADVSLSRLRSIRVYVVGDVAHPGAYDISSLSTPLNAIFAAGGPTERGSLRNLEQYRGKQLVQNVDVYDLLLHGVKADIQRLENGDTVLVPPIGPDVTVEGMVRRPSIYELRDEKSLADVLELAGGLLPTATLRHIEVQRVVAHDKRTMLSVDVPPTDDSAAITKQLDSFHVQDGDKIRIFPIAPYNQDTVYLEGHALRPGRYSYHAGMRVTDLISSYKDLLPEPATEYAEIIRLNAPDYRPTVESFNLADALSHPASAPLLDPLDTVQIFGRYDFQNPPTISVWGDVREPGTYRSSGQIHLSDAIHMAGGLGPDAEREDAQVFRYLPDGKMKIFSVKLSEALDGNPLDNIVLNSRDRVLVHSNPAEVDPATVYIKGEVARPGRYPLTTNMSIADLIHSAGGLQQSADAQAADLTHYQWTSKGQMTGQHEQVNLTAVLAGDTKTDAVLHNGDVLTISQLPGWNDLGATIQVRGEVKHPGSYGIRPGETLSSVLARAGGFMPDAYPYGALLERGSVRSIEDKSQEELIQRIRGMQTQLKLAATTDPDQKLAQETAYQQWQTTLENLTNTVPVGRVTIEISSRIRSWQNTSRDSQVRAGDVLIIPKRPTYVMVQGQVYNPTAVSYRPGRSAKWYLSQGGGPTNLANKRAIFVIRADGTVIASKGSSLFFGGALNDSLQPGDMVVVPEKAIGGPSNWKGFFQAAQVLSAVTTSAILAAKY
ncbi:MAG TPA: SLBB domain-containing protein [Candidatus Acidoferrales bacterium]|nr:SLBB domain-containing protein [Candidatus Acidoferrales bacterium]